ncbi:MBL fold metallo-hydrolase [Arsenicicoccus dermatophilus]|uniref:MBL fold metallo-hydrolase n=1 Tax=Arsenicicoccus dermatophilus TaxID=1076331 RepID=UPI001F4C9A8D|nr:MBL fold metallo-hydrolase [Arsenicicoccus dermatophilus]MCH8611852.1 MBL fold metallo-hydrolase [Arsenicicoccus dermatophilus]
MIFTQHYLDCLSQASYLVADEGTQQAVVVDPRRDVTEYLEEASTRGLTIVGIINTHFHADFVSGHLELAESTGAWIGYGDAASPEFAHRSLSDGERVSLGDVTLQIMSTPGHTPESISVLVFEHADDETAYGVLTGDALFIGDVGRPDLLASVGTTADELARQLYDSVQHKLMALSDAVRVFPAHGAGSACGKNLSTERQSTIGEQRRTNYACRPMSEDEFVAVVTEGQPAAPAYFAYDAALNKQQRPTLDRRPVPALDEEALRQALTGGAVVVDTRPTAEYAAAHLVGSVNVPADGRTAETVGMLLRPDQRIVLVAPEGLEQTSATRLARIGYDHVLGYLPDLAAHLDANPEAVAHASRLRVDELDTVPADAQLIDVRGPGEVADGTIPGATNIPLPQLAQRLAELDPTRPVVVSCASGWRSNVAASYLRHAGFADVSDLIGGYDAWAAARSSAG